MIPSHLHPTVYPNALKPVRFSGSQNVKSEQDLKVRRNLSVQIIEANQKIMSLIDGTEKMIRDGLLAEGVNSDQAGFREGRGCFEPSGIYESI